MIILPRRRIRIFGDASREPGYPMLDALTGKSPQHWRGNALQVDVAVAYNGTVCDVSNIVSLTVELFASDKTTRYAFVTLGVSDISNTLTDALWAAGNAQHASAVFSMAQMNVAAGSYWMVVSVVTAAGDDATLTAGVFTMAEDGHVETDESVTNNPTYYTQEQVRALFVPRAEDNSFVRFQGGQQYLYIAATGLWHPMVGAIVDGQPHLTLGTGVAL